MVSVHSDASLLALWDASGTSDVSPEALESSNGLVCVLKRGGFIISGIDSGPVNVEVQRVDSAPELHMTGWDEAADVSFHSPSGDVRVGSLFDFELPNLPSLTLGGPGWYRLRCYARGRAVLRGQIEVKHMVEDYLLIAWPAEFAPDQVHALLFHPFAR